MLSPSYFENGSLMVLGQVSRRAARMLRADGIILRPLTIGVSKARLAWGSDVDFVPRPAYAPAAASPTACSVASKRDEEELSVVPPPVEAVARDLSSRAALPGRGERHGVSDGQHNPHIIAFFCPGCGLL